MNTENFISLARGIKPLDLVGNLPENSLALEQRLFFAQQTIRNTLVKLGHLRRPDDLLWALHNGGSYHAIGFAKAVGSIAYSNGTTFKDITEDVRAGKAELTEDTYIRFAITYPGSSSIGQGYIQIKYLRNDPIAIAQMVRRALTNHENAQRNLDRTMIARELKQLEQDKAAFERNHARNVERTEKKLALAYKQVGKKVRKQGTRTPVLVG